jgi:RimJ/RimL family protein N-acetyltransferase
MAAADHQQPRRGTLQIRQAEVEDGRAIRALVTMALMRAGFDPPSAELDPDLDDLTYYTEPGRGAWVAIDDETVVGFAGVERGTPEGDAEVASLRRLVGEGLSDLARTAGAFARGRGASRVEAIAAPDTERARQALEAAGFVASGDDDSLLYRREL